MGFYPLAGRNSIFLWGKEIFMRAVLQRVCSASVTVEEKEISRIKNGLLILLGVEGEDSVEQAKALASKLRYYAFLKTENGKLNRSLLDIKGEALVVSNFTLCADCRKGTRPSFSNAAPAQQADLLYQEFCRLLQEQGVTQVQTGQFGAYMQISLINDGPVTIILEADQEGIH